MNEIANALYRQQKYQEAERAHRDLLGVCQRLLGEGHPLTIETMNSLGCTLYYMNNFREAADLHRTALEAYRRSVGKGHVKTLISKLNLADALLHLGEYREAELHYRDVLERIEGRDDERRSLKRRTAEGLLRVLEAEGRTREAENLRNKEGVKPASPQGDSAPASIRGD